MFVRRTALIPKRFELSLPGEDSGQEACFNISISTAAAQEGGGADSFRKEELLPFSSQLPRNLRHLAVGRR